MIPCFQLLVYALCLCHLADDGFQQLALCGVRLRRQKAGNRRSLCVSLTEKGLDAANRMTDVFCSAETSAAEGLTAEETDRLRELLDKLCDTMQSQSEGKKKET